MGTQAKEKKISVSSYFSPNQLVQWRSHRQTAIDRIRETSNATASWAEYYFRTNPDISVFEFAPIITRSITDNTAALSDQLIEDWIVLYLASSLLDDFQDDPDNIDVDVGSIVTLVALGTSGVCLSLSGGSEAKNIVRREIQRALRGQIQSVTNRSPHVSEAHIAAEKNSLLNVAAVIASEGTDSQTLESLQDFSRRLRLPFQVMDDLDDLLEDFKLGTRTTFNKEGRAIQSKAELHAAIQNLATSGDAQELLAFAISEIEQVISPAAREWAEDSPAYTLLRESADALLSVSDQFDFIANLEDQSVEIMDTQVNDLLRKIQVVAVGS